MSDHDELGDALLDEAAHIIQSFWTPEAICELAEDGIPIVAPDGCPMIISATSGDVLWRGGTVPWMLAMWISAKNLHVKMSASEGV